MVPATLKANWYYVLLALSRGPRHGQAVAREVEQMTDARVRLWPATLYGSLDALIDHGWIEEVDDEGRPDESERRRYFALTRSGRAVLAEETRRLEDLVRIARAARRRGSS